MTRLRATILVITLGALVALVCLLVARSRAHRDFVDACKQEQPIERCEAMWRAGGVR